MYTQISTTATTIALTPGQFLTIGSQYVKLRPDFGTLTSPLVSGNGYSSLNVTGLPYGIAAGTVITIGSSSTNQPVTVTSAASVGATSISVNLFTANANYATGTKVLAPSVPAGSTTIPVNKFVAVASPAAGSQVQALGLPKGAIIIPVNNFTANATYSVGSTLTLQGDQEGVGGTANSMVVAGRYYPPWNDPYYYTFFIGERKTDNNPSCSWIPMFQGACGWREILEEARTTDFVNWEVLTNKPVASGGPWVAMSAVDSNYYPIPVTDRNGNPIEGSYPSTAGGVGGLLGSVNQVYTADGVHTFRYFYSDHPNTGNWQSDLQIWNLYERDASTNDSGAFDTTGNIIWSAPHLIGRAPGGGLVRVAKAHGANRWALVFSASNGTNPTTDAQVEYSADMTGLTYDQWLTPLTHLLSVLPPDGTDYLNLQVGRLYGSGYSYTDPTTGLAKGYGDLIAQVDFMTDRDGNIAAPDAETPGYTRGGMLIWTDFPVINDNSMGNNNVYIGAYEANIYRAGFDVSGNVTGDLAVNGNFATQTFTGNATLDGWTMIDNSNPSVGGGTNYPASVLNGSTVPNAVAALVGPALSYNSESIGGSGIAQTITIPSGAHSASLSFSYWPECPAGGSDYQTVYVYNVDTGVSTFAITPKCDNSQTWRSGTLDLSTLIGHPAMFIVETRKVSTTNTAPVRVRLGCQTSCFSVKVN